VRRCLALEGGEQVKALVTGGAGFIGSHVVDRLLSEGNEVVALDNFDAAYDRRIKEMNVAAHLTNPLYRLINDDILADSAYDRLRLEARRLGGVDAIVHLAARAGVRPSIDDPAGYQRVNGEGTQRMLEFAREQRIGQFVFASSSSVYGANPNVPWSERDLDLMPISPYASSKISGESMGRVYSQLHGIRFLALRFFTVYGPRQRPDLAINRFVKCIMEDRPITLFGTGRTRRDYTYVGDLVEGMVAALRYDAADFEVVNLGSGRPIELLEMVREIEKALGRAAQIEMFPEQPGDVGQTFADIDKARRLFGYTPSTPFSDGVREFILWRNEPCLIARLASREGVS
jgi:UDP-glucuronate 4-epimerase